MSAPGDTGMTMRYLPAIELTDQVRLLLAHDALRLQPGQWVSAGTARGRYLRTDPRRATTYVNWVRPHDTWKDQADRFHRACVKGYVGRYAALYRPRDGARVPFRQAA